MSDEDFKNQVSPLPDYDDYYFAPADFSLGAMATSRAYLALKSLEDVLLFKEKFDGYVFVDQKGNEYPAVVEFSPFQGLARSRVKKRDTRINTIETDSHYLNFLESLKQAEENKAEGKLEYSYQVKEEVEITSTPLLEFLANKKRVKIEERKRKQDERRKRRDEERHRKKQEVSKAIPEPVKEAKNEKKPVEEKVEEDDGIIVRVVPSRLDRKQREKAKEMTRKEKMSERNRERKEKHEKERRENKEKEGKPQKQRDSRGAKDSRSSRQNEKQTKDTPPATIPDQKPPAVESKNLEKPIESKQQTSAQPKREIRKYSELRKEIRERAEQRRFNTENVEMENVETMLMEKLSLDQSNQEAEGPNSKSGTTLNVAAKEFTPCFVRTRSSSTESEKHAPGATEEGGDPRDKESESSDASKPLTKEEKKQRDERRIRNKDRPSLEIYKPRRVRNNFSDSDNKQVSDQKTSKAEDDKRESDEDRRKKEPKTRGERRKERGRHGKDDKGDRRQRMRKPKAETKDVEQPSTDSKPEVTRTEKSTEKLETQTDEKQVTNVTENENAEEVKQ